MKVKHDQMYELYNYVQQNPWLTKVSVEKSFHTVIIWPSIKSEEEAERRHIVTIPAI